MIPTQMGYGYGWYAADSFFSFNEKEYSHGRLIAWTESRINELPRKRLNQLLFLAIMDLHGIMSSLEMKLLRYC